MYTAPESSARSLLLTVLGELVVPDGEPVWTASLLYALARLGVSEHAARQAISRAAEGGWIESEKLGRDVRWSVTPLAVRIIDEITRRVVSLNTTPEFWDGNCLIIIVSITYEKRSVRKRLYSALSWAGFGNPAPGLWASPHVDRLEETREIIHELGLREMTIAFIGRLADVGLTDHEIVQRAWNPDDVAARYAKLLDNYQGVEPEPGDDLLFRYLALVDEWRKFPAMDPQLPRDLLPDWIGRRAADTFVTLRATWKSAARAHWRDVVDLTAPDV
jgi:phenylacetic acid degradation operon negative regulatory protein